MSDIFVSYAREDRDFAKELAASLEEEGWSIWWDRTIPTGQRFHQVIEQALAAARCVIVVWSRHSVGSDWVRAEAGEGMARNILAPVSIDAASPPLVFRQLQTADLSGWTGDNAAEEFRKLVADITSIAPPSRPGETEERPAPVASPAPSTPALESAEPVPPEPVSAAPEVRPAPKRARWPWVLGAVAILGIALVAFWLGGQPEPRQEGSGRETHVEKPTIVLFEARPPSVPRGEPSLLVWRVEGAESIGLSESVEGARGRPVGDSGSLEVRPRQTTAYTLDAANEAGAVWREVSVRVEAGRAADLKFVGWSFDPPTPVQREPVEIRIAVENVGGADAGGFEIQWWPGVNYPEPGCAWPVPALAAGARHDVRCRYDGYPSWYARIESVAKIDPQMRVRDADRSNNEWVREISVARP